MNETVKTNEMKKEGSQVQNQNDHIVVRNKPKGKVRNPLVVLLIVMGSSLLLTLSNITQES